MNKTSYNEIKRDCLHTLLNLHKHAGVGHIASSLSVLDILIFLYFYKMQTQDRCILSKGHAATALYTVLAKSGRIKEELLDTFERDGTTLAMHPSCLGQISDITFGTGSLGHGLSLATGLALSQRWTKNDFEVFCVLSDGDLNEGSTWEAIMFSSQHALSNLTVIVDYNRVQAFGATEEVLNLEPLVDKFKSFGFNVETAQNGNDFVSINDAFNKSCTNNDDNKPRCIIAQTIKGSGISFMENKIEWHYLPMSDEQYEQALQEINNVFL